jgi:type II secretory pathway component PulK
MGAIVVAQVSNRLSRAGGAKMRRRAGAALLVSIFVLALTSALVVSMLEIETIQMTASRNVLYHEQALFLAGAAAHHALAELEADAAWRTGIPSTQYPAGSGNTYSATVVNGLAGQVVVTGVGNVGDVTRRVQVTVEL